MFVRRCPIVRVPSRSAARVVLVGCVSKKQALAAPAKDLYVSDLFRKRRAYVESSGLRWFILSALHGVLDPEDEIEPYDVRLSKLPRRERMMWGQRVARELEERLGALGAVTFEVHAGAAYAEAIEGPIGELGGTVVLPLAGLPIGRQLQWAMDQLGERGELVIDVETVGYRSAFVGASPGDPPRGYYRDEPAARPAASLVKGRGQVFFVPPPGGSSVGNGGAA